MNKKDLLVVDFGDQATWVPVRFLGKDIELKIRPYASDISAELNQKHTSYELVKDDKGGYVKDQKTEIYVRLPRFDMKGYMTDMLDHHIEDVRGVGTTGKKALQWTPENKYRLCHLPVPEGAESLADIVFAKSRELAVIRDDAARQEDENL